LTAGLLTTRLSLRERDCGLGRNSAFRPELWNIVELGARCE